MLNRLSVLIIATALFGLLQLGGVVSSLSDKALDILYLLRGPVEPSQDIIIIGVDEESLAALGAWPFPRKHHAELLGRLGKARVIGFDFLFSEPTEQDKLLAAAIRSSPPVILASAHNFQYQILHPAPSLAGYFGSGHIEIIIGRDGVVREAETFHHYGHPALPAFALVMLKGAGMESDLTAASKPILINHYGPKNTFLYLSYFDVLQGTFPEDFFKDRFVLIGAEALGIGDSHVTPFSRQHPTPGVEIQATILNNLLDDSYLKPLPAVSWFFMACIALMSMLIWPTRGENWNLVINLSLAALLTVSSFFLFRLSLFPDPAPVLLFLALTFLVHLVTERLWTARKIFGEMSRLDRQLETQLQQVYTNIPTQFFNLQPTPTKGGIRRHLAHLQAGVKVLSLQHHFIENLLREELPPLILWDRHSGIVIIANTMFNTFWSKHSPEQSALPDLDQFIHLLREKQPAADKARLDVTALLDDTQMPAIDIGLTEHGRKKYFRIHMRPVEVADIEFNGVLAVLTDVTEIKELEQLKDEIVSVVSHELKLPLTVILGYGEMLAGTLQNDEKQYIDEICSQARRQNRLIEDFLDVTRLEHGRKEIRRFPLDLVRLVQEAVNTVSIPAGKKSIEVIPEIPFRATPVIGDYSLLLQAVINLLDNAIKFSPAGTQISIRLTEETERFTLCVADQGPGVPAESREEIFDKFNRGRQVSGQDGFGLGLNFVKQVVQKHNGEIWLEPETTVGATFCITLAKASVD